MPALQELTEGGTACIGREKAQDKETHHSWLCASRSRDRDGAGLCTGKGREQSFCLYPSGHGREEVTGGTA